MRNEEVLMVLPEATKLLGHCNVNPLVPDVH